MADNMNTAGTSTPPQPPQHREAANEDSYNGAAKEPSYARRFIDSVNPGFGVAGGAALWTAVLSIDRNFDSLLKRNGRLAPINRAAAHAYDEVYHSWTKNIPEADRAALNAPENDLIRGVHWEKYFTAEELAKRREAISAESKHPGKIAAWRDEVINTRLKDDGITNTWQKFKRLTHYERHAVIGTFITIAAVGLGAVYTFQHERHLEERVRQEQRKNDSHQQR